MKLPRGVSGDRLVRALERLDYSVFVKRAVTSGCDTRDRRSMSSPFLCTTRLKTGTLHAVLTEVAQMRSIGIESIIDLL